MGNSGGTSGDLLPTARDPERLYILRDLRDLRDPQAMNCLAGSRRAGRAG